MRIRRNDPQYLLRWTFLRGNELLTCQIHRRRSGLYRLSLIPHSTNGMSAVETFPTTMRALHRHAALAAELRQDGWTVVSYGGQAPRTPTHRSTSDAIAA